MQQEAAPLRLLKIAAIVVTVLFSVGTVAAGALLSIDTQISAVMLRLHQILPVHTLLSTTGTVYLLLPGRSATPLGVAWCDACKESR